MTKAAYLSSSFARTVSEQVRAAEPVRRKLPVWGRVHIERPLPFLCVYRRPSERRDPATARLATSQAAYLVAPGDEPFYEDLSDLVAALGHEAIEAFGDFVLVEMWSTPAKGTGVDADASTLRPTFRIVAPEHEPLENTVTAMAKAFQQVTLHEQLAEITIDCAPSPAPPGMAPLLPEAMPGCTIGLEVTPCYRSQQTGEVYPFLFQVLRRQVNVAFKKTWHVFAATRTTLHAPHVHTLGRSRLGKTARAVDAELTQLDASFDFLLQTTPVNAREAWDTFEACGFAEEPTFHYRPLPVDPELIKRRLFDLPIERVEDPVLEFLFREKQEEMDRKVTMLRDRGTRAFFFGSLQLFGEVEAPLLALAEKILERLPEREDTDTPGALFNEHDFARVARDEFDAYRRDCAAFPEAAQLRDDMPPGLMVSQGQLLIGKDTRVPESRVDALIQHEVGTHMLTYFNGQAQPLKLLSEGLAGYEALQEGLAVLSEYLVDGLTVARLRVLAARVVAAHCLIRGAPFTEVFEMLCATHGFEPRTAFTIAMRTFRGGGLIKDVIYLRGLSELAHYLQDDGALEPLFVGKIALQHVPLIEELTQRGLLREPPLRPRCLNRPATPAHLEQVRSGLTFIDLMEKRIA